MSKLNTKLKLHQDFSNCDDEMSYLRESGIFQFEEDLFSKNAKLLAMIMQEVLILIIFF